MMRFWKSTATLRQAVGRFPLIISSFSLTPWKLFSTDTNEPIAKYSVPSFGDRRDPTSTQDPDLNKLIISGDVLAFKEEIIVSFILRERKMRAGDSGMTLNRAGGNNPLQKV